jgi:mono/diheme cytochrome c family protein
MPQRRRSRPSLVALVAPLALLATTVFLALVLVGATGIAWSQMGRGRDPIGGTPPSRPAESAPASKEPPNGPAPRQSGLTSPLDLRDPEVIREGSILFATTCSYCHKRAASPGASGAAPTLWDQVYERDYLFKMISEGPPSRRMPAWKHQYSPEQIWKLVAYILSFKGTESK